MSEALAPNRIHSLPVQINYHLPSSPQAFTTTFESLQQVYVHPNAAPSKSLGEDEAWGSIYLKSVVQGVLRASPELHPSHSGSPELSLYILDPRETYLRRSRVSPPFPSLVRSTSASSPDVQVTSLGLDQPQPAEAMQEVWTGKGLLTWALEEPGDGKNLITGRLVRSREFGQVVRSQGMSALESMMMMADEGDSESWGIEISLGLRSGTSGPIGSHPQIQQVMAMNVKRNDVFRRAPASATASTSAGSIPRFEVPERTVVPLLPAAPRLDGPSSVRPQFTHPLSPTRMVSTTPHVRARDTIKKHPSGRRKKAHQPDQSRSAQNNIRSIDREAPRPPSRHASSSRRVCSDSPEPNSDTSPNDIPAQVFTNPETLTMEQAERLIDNPTFLSMLEKVTGQPIEAARNLKRRREQEQSDALKRIKIDPSLKLPEPPTAPKVPSSPQSVLKCCNCGRTKSAVWRMKTMEDGKSVRVCNACGLYWNKLRQMRPPTVWAGVDDDVKNLAKRDRKTPLTPAPSSDNGRVASRIDGGNGLKRSLSAVVEQDAIRLAGLRSRPSVPKSSLSQTIKAIPMTSPPRASTSVSRSVRNSRWNGDAPAGASSPGGWAESAHTVPHSDNFHPMNESPNTAVRRILGGDTPIQSLDMPLSDDGTMTRPTDGTTFNWDTDLSAFFDVEGFSLDAEPTQGRSPIPETTDFHRALSSSARRRREGTSTEDDDVLSQLFNNTSSSSIGTSPTPFDFSQLPPSSPPAMPSDLPHSALLLSSPDNSPMEFSPLEKDHLPRFTPENRSNLSYSFIPNDEKAATGLQYHHNHYDESHNMLHELLGKMQEGDEAMVSSAGVGEGMLGGVDLLALLNSSFSEA